MAASYRKGGMKCSGHGLVERLEGRTLLSAGDLDSAFGKKGVATFSFGRGVDAPDVAVQHDGKIVVAMYFAPSSGGNRLLVARFTQSGKLDKNFATAANFQ